MEIIKNALEQIANNDKIKASGDKIKQDQRNVLRNELLNIFAQELAEKLDSDLISFGRVEKGIVIQLDNEDVGFIPILLDLKFMSLDYDMESEVEDYKLKLETKLKEKAEAEKVKAQKIKADKERRERAKAEKAEA